MGVKVAGSCLNWCQTMLPRSSSSPRTLASASIFSSLSPKRCGNGAVKLWRRRTWEDRGCKGQKHPLRAYRASLERFSSDDDDEGDEEEFVKRLQELTVELQGVDAGNDIPDSRNWETAESASSFRNEASLSAEPPWPAVIPEPPRWLNGEDIVPASVEMTANSAELPVSLRIIKRKKRWEEGLKEAGESACCSVKKAFSSMVFIVRELQTYALQTRDVPFYGDIQGILARVQGEMNASFVWLFQQIFSCTPTLMVYVMLLLANFTVYSIASDSAIAAVASNPPAATVEQEYQQTRMQQNSRFDAPSVKSFSVGRTASVGGGGGGGGKVKPVAGATDDGRPDGSYSSYNTQKMEEADVWNGIVEEAHRMQATSRDEALMDPETLQQLVSPVSAELEHENYPEYSQTELMYYQALSRDPDNVLLLSNFAQFLYLVLHDHHRAEHYFRRAVGIKPGDAEAWHRYGNFLWIARNELGAAEEAYLEAIAADPSNSYYAADYAHFLWNTGGEDTCFPLDGGDAR